MTGDEFRRLRIDSGMTIGDFAVRILGWKGNHSTITRGIARLEKQPEISPKTVKKLREAKMGDVAAAARKSAEWRDEIRAGRLAGEMARTKHGRP